MILWMIKKVIAFFHQRKENSNTVAMKACSTIKYWHAGKKTWLGIGLLWAGQGTQFQIPFKTLSPMTENKKIILKVWGSPQ